MIELVRKQYDDVIVIQEHRRKKTLATDINNPTGYRLFMNDTHTHPASVALDMRFLNDALISSSIHNFSLLELENSSFIAAVVVVVELPQAPEDDPQKR